MIKEIIKNILKYLIKIIKEFKIHHLLSKRSNKIINSKYYKFKIL